MHKVALSFNDGRTHFVGVNGNEVLIDAAMRHGLTLPVDCREGVCASCKGTCQSGDYDLEYVDEDALSEDDLAKGGILACQMRVKKQFAYCSSVHWISSKKFKKRTKAIRLVKVKRTRATTYVSILKEFRLRYRFAIPFRSRPD